MFKPTLKKHICLKQDTGDILLMLAFTAKLILNLSTNYCMYAKLLLLLFCVHT